MLKKTSLTIFMLVLAAGSILVQAQRKTKSPGKRQIGRNVRVQPVNKIEIENWKEFESNELKLKLIFPKVPTVSVDYTEIGDLVVKSSVVQSYINSDFYMVEVREHPPGFIPPRTDMGENYGQWLRTFILSRVKVLSEKSFDFREYKMVEFVYQQTENEITVHRAMVVGDNLYQFIVQFEVKKPETVEQIIAKNKGKLDKFFLSFELTGEEFVS